MELFTAKQYLQIDIANNFGLDKKDWQERLAWFNETNEAGKLMAEWENADEPALYFAGLKAWNEYLTEVPSGYPISLDATSSGFQILACLTRDVLAAKLCNVLNTGHREDAYTLVFDKLAQAVLDEMGEAAGKVTRDQCKKAIMTALYGSEAEPKAVFGEGMQLTLFYQTMARLAPAAWDLNQYYLDIWDPTETMHSWTLPDNFHVHVKVVGRSMEEVHFLNTPYETYRSVVGPKEKGRSLGANSTHSIDGMMVREMTRRCMYDPAKIEYVRSLIAKYETGAVMLEDVPTGADADMVEILWGHYEESGFLSMRIVDYLTLDTMALVGDTDVLKAMLDTLPAKPFQIVSIHDCFRCLPKYGNDLRRQYNQILSDIAKSRMLQFMLRQIMKKPDFCVELPNPDMWKEVLEANYSLS